MSPTRQAVLAIDQGTTGTTALLLDAQVQVLAAHNVEFKNHYPKPGHVEHDTADIWASVEAAVTGALQKAGGPVEIVAIGITNQRETSLFWHKTTGAPIHRALVWQDRRTADRCQALKDAGHEERVRAMTGLVLDPYFSGTKAAWLLDHVPGARAAAESGELAFGTIDAWLAWKLCGAHATDPSNASRTLLFDIHRMEWSQELLDLLGVPGACLPRICDNAEVLGITRGLGFLPDGIPVSGMAGDQQAALFGQACFDAGMAKCTYGTGAFVLMNTGGTAVTSHSGLLTTVGWRLDGRVVYALEGSAFIAGAAVQWLRDGLGLIQSAAEIEALATSVPDSDGVMFVPALAGLGAPHWRPDARGILTGLTRGTTRAHIARAVLDGVALQISDILTAMSGDAGTPLAELRVDGGAARNDLLMQFQADVLGVRCVRPTVLETTALGSAFLAGLGAGFWSSPQAISDAWTEDRAFTPAMSDTERHRQLAAWAAAVAKA
ncbi:MAG: glycerol kinase GlpK [Alphaproteobacteria bacterium]|nr:glycerol kinase GlpK [Alphaproteobacteria bacterium]